MAMNNSSADIERDRPRKIAVIGGGLAGLSTTYHLLNKLQDSGVMVTVFDVAPVGVAGASAVAGGLLHPLSPRGKIVHWGLECLEATNRLIQVSLDVTDEGTSQFVVLRDEIFRLALSDEHVKQLQQTAAEYPSLAEWIDIDALRTAIHPAPSRLVLGGLRLRNGCKLLHVPTYLKHLWQACERLAARTGSHVEWSIVKGDGSEGANLRDRVVENDTVVYAAGSGMFSAALEDSLPPKLLKSDFPIQIVHGQSVELRVEHTMKDSSAKCSDALLCGKYISPLPDSNTFLVGATHEFQSILMQPSAVVEDLRTRTMSMAPWLWEGSSVQRLTKGSRVQSARGKYGRRPMIGRLLGNKWHPNAWVFTGLSSRGLLYHALYGDILTDAIIDDDENTMLKRCPDIIWWRSKLV